MLIKKKDHETDKASSMHGRDAYKILVGKLKGREHLEDLGVDGE
jgi:hypothetical protein